MGFPQQCKCQKCGERFYAYPDRRGSTGRYPKYCSRQCYLDALKAQKASRKWLAERKAEEAWKAAVPGMVLAALDSLHRWCEEHGHDGSPEFAQATAALAAAAVMAAGTAPAPTE